ncbi:polysaccharide deacetylase family protein [Cyanobacterium aponinum]|uniref:polysaccharide deacetylase family protein n=1 Tax=Cyanobacterium aponinum TaxID=379064 RepID=UPI000C12AFAC|nr:polysaccharide deacetylase family protein [Cyanobacterium aponinum]PHV63417.1 chitooligosaccharide deacetylase [Cyanobacterium aponinum IPPAS B-1201]
MSNNHFNGWNLILIFIASISVGVLSAYIYTSDYFSQKKLNLSPTPTKEESIDSKSKNTIKSSENKQITSNQNNSNIESYQLENLEKTYKNYLNQGIFFIQITHNSLSQINQNLDEIAGKTIIENIQTSIENAEKFFIAIPSTSIYYDSAQKYRQYNFKYSEYSKKWEDYFNNKKVYSDQQIKLPNYPDLTIKNKSVFVSAMKPKSIVLTFDDGPTPQYTIKILDILKKYNIKATFFVVGKRVKDNCPIVQRMYQEGHEIGNHSYTHTYLTKIPTEQQKQEIVYTQQIIKQCVGSQPRWFRAPFGDQNPTLLNMVNHFGLNNAQWTIDTNDWRSSSTIKSITNLAVNNNSSAVILMHDGAKTNPDFIHSEESLTRINTVNALENIIINYQNRGFVFYTLSNAIND